MNKYEILLYIVTLISIFTALKCYSKYAALKFQYRQKTHICKYNDNPGCYERCCGYCSSIKECNQCCGGYCDKCPGHTVK